MESNYVPTNQYLIFYDRRVEWTPYHPISYTPLEDKLRFSPLTNFSISIEPHKTEVT